MGLLGIIGDAFNDIFGGNSSRKDSQKYNLQNMEIQQQYAERNMHLQNEYNIQAFNRENEYNSPVAQKLRNYQAGINPNWQDGSAVVAQQDSGVSASAPSGAMPSGSNVGGVGDILNLVKLGSELKNINADTTKKDKEGNAALLDAESNQRQAEAAEENAKANVQNSQSQKALVPSQVFKNTMDGLLSLAKNITEKAMRSANVAEVLSRVTKNLKDADVSEATVHRIETLLKPELNNIIADTANKLADTAKKKSETYRNYQEVKQQWKSIGIDAMNAETNRGNMLIHGKEVDEMIRQGSWNRKMGEMIFTIQDKLADGQLNYWSSGAKLINAQAIYQEIENKFRFYLRANGLDAEQVEVFLFKARTEGKLNEAKTWLTQEEADMYEFNTLSNFATKLGLNWNKVPGSSTPPGPVTTTPPGPVTTTPQGNPYNTSFSY